MCQIWRWSIYGTSEHTEPLLRIVPQALEFTECLNCISRSSHDKTVTLGGHPHWRNVVNIRDRHQSLVWRCVHQCYGRRGVQHNGRRGRKYAIFCDTSTQFMVASSSNSLETLNIDHVLPDSRRLQALRRRPRRTQSSKCPTRTQAKNSLHS